MISFDPLWKTMRKNNATTYTLRIEGGLSSSTVSRIKSGDSISTRTIDVLCKLFNCGVEDIISYQYDKN